MPKYKGILASSQDPAQLSLTVESVSKVLIGLIGWFAVSKGMDVATAQTLLQQILDIVAQSIPMIYALYHAMHTAWGLVRKLLNYFRHPAQQ